MKLAIPTSDNRVDDHFGHSEYFTIYTIENNQVIKSERMDSLKGCGCKSNLVDILAEKGVTLMLAGNMGQGAYIKLANAGVEVIRGCSGSIDTLLQNYLEGKISDQNIICDHQHHHEAGHQCSHH